MTALSTHRRVASITDWLDGYIARKRGIVTTFGKLMDALTDKIMVLGIMVAMVDRNYHPIPLAFVLMAIGAVIAFLGAVFVDRNGV